MPISSRAEKQSVVSICSRHLVPSVAPEISTDKYWFAVSAWSYIFAIDYAPFLKEVTDNREDCFGRRFERGLVSCLRRADEDELALRRPPECPTELACPVGGCS
jgi:hypothetical protein